jgi:hypothetical protein
MQWRAIHFLFVSWAYATTKNLILKDTMIENSASYGCAVEVEGASSAVDISISNFTLCWASHAKRERNVPGVAEFAA